jgi:sugar lactone lactonase YvrE
MPELRTLVTGLGIGESARWHDGRLWFCHWGAQEVVAVDLDGNREVVVANTPAKAGYSIDWLPDGRLLVTGPELLRREADGTLVRHADLSGIAGGWNEIVVDGRGNIYVNGMGFDVGSGEAFAPGVIALVTPDGAARQVASDIAFPNGMVVTPDNTTLVIVESFAGRLTAFDIAADGSLSNRRVWAPVPGDGICLDAEGAIWCQSFEEGSRGAVTRVREGGEVLQKVQLDRPCYACTLGGDDGTTLFMMAAEWWGFEKLDELLQAGTGRVLATHAPAPHAGWP